MTTKQFSELWIVDFGSQYTQLIVRSLRELGYFAELLVVEEAVKRLKENISPKGIILSGGPNSVFNDTTDFSLFFKSPQIAILGICYGMQIMAHALGGKVARGEQGEYGKAEIFMKRKITPSLQEKTIVWMSHFDQVKVLPPQFLLLMESESKVVAAMQHQTYPWIGFQFHPEVNHTIQGKDFLQYFLSQIPNMNKNWQQDSMKKLCLENLIQAKDKNVLCAFSGGVDSLVAARLTSELVGKNLYCFYVDHGMMRPQDKHHIQELKKASGLNIEVIDAKDIFLSQLKGVTDPERKRKIIGHTFIEVFEKKVHEFEKSHQLNFDFLLQGTLFPDVIESISPHKKGGKSVVIKSHHNVGGLPETMKLKLLEPLRWLFKDEVRDLGRQLGLRDEWLWRHPFPGPGLSVRILGEINEERLSRLKAADNILDQELRSSGYYQECWQAAVVDLGIKSVGVKGDERAYESVVALRIVQSVDAMTAKWSEVPYSILDQISRRLTNEVLGISRVVYDITSKPPGTIEWE